MGACSDKSRDHSDHHDGGHAPKSLHHTTERIHHESSDFRSHPNLESHVYGDHHSDYRRPTQEDIKNSVCLYVKCDLVYHSHEMPHIRDLDSFRKHAKSGAFEPWSHVKGLRSKIFWLHAESNTTGGLYTFFSRRHLEDYMESDLFKSMNHVPFLKNVRHEIHENLAGGELCADMGVWRKS